MSELKAYKMVDEKYCTDCVCVIPSDVYLKSEADKVIADLEESHKKEVEQLLMEIVRLKQKLEDAKASHYAEMVDAEMRERRLRRALWIARAMRARDIQRWWISATCAPITERACRIWNNVERKCRAKAEQYK